jgi:hypothetical protein
MNAPDLRVGDTILFYPDPLNDSVQPLLGWALTAIRTNDAANLLVYTPEVGFVEKVAIRWRFSDDIEKRTSVRAMGGWDLSPVMKDMAKINNMKMDAMIAHENASVKDKKTVKKPVTAKAK